MNNAASAAIAKEGVKMNQERKARKLLDEGFGCIGMIAEANSKLVLFKSRIRDAKSSGVVPEDLVPQTRAGIRQIKKDLATYSRRLNEIYTELEDNGFFADMD